MEKIRASVPCCCNIFLLLPSRGYAEANPENLKGHVEVQVSSDVWTYTVFNDEPAGSTKNINTFFFDGPADYTVISSPKGWVSRSKPPDGILWENFESALVQGSTIGQIAPGKSLDGFQIRVKEAPPAHPYGLQACLDKKCEKSATMFGKAIILRSR